MKEISIPVKVPEKRTQLILTFLVLFVSSFFLFSILGPQEGDQRSHITDQHNQLMQMISHYESELREHDINYTEWCETDNYEEYSNREDLPDVHNECSHLYR